MSPTRNKTQSKKMGYFDGLQQPCIEFSFSLVVPQDINFEQIDQWLCQAFEIVVGEHSLQISESSDHVQQKVAKFIWRIMHLSCILHEAIRIPKFAVGKIISLTRDNDQSESWRSIVAVPFVHYATQTTNNFAFQIASKVLFWITKNIYNDENRDYLFKFINDSFVKKIQYHQFGGESTIPILKQVWAKNIPFKHLGNGTYQIGFGAKSIIINRGANHFDSAIGASISNNKWLTANLLRDAGLPAATHYKVNSTQSIEDIVKNLGWPLVVKPLDRDRGEGVTVNISNMQMLQDAIKFALSLSKTALIEKQVPGICHRIFVADGKVHVVAKRMPKSIKGDGVNTIRALVNQANAEENLKPIWRRLKPFPLDDLALSTLAKNNFHPDTILAEGAFAALRPIQTSEWGGVVEDFLDNIHPANLAIAIKAANLFNLSNAGIDIISEDITRPWYETGAIINEVNYSPLITGRGQRNVISQLLDEWCPNAGKIPIEVFLGDNTAFIKAKTVQSNYAKKGIKCWLTSDITSLSPTGEVIHLAVKNLFFKASALLLDKSVEALLIVIQNDELLKTGLPVPYIDCIHDMSNNLDKVSKSKNNQTRVNWQKQMLDLLQAHSRKNAIN